MNRRKRPLRISKKRCKSVGDPKYFQQIFFSCGSYTIFRQTRSRFSSFTFLFCANIWRRNFATQTSRQMFSLSLSRARTLSLHLLYYPSLILFSLPLSFHFLLSLSFSLFLSLSQRSQNSFIHFSSLRLHSHDCLTLTRSHPNTVLRHREAH